MARAILPSQFNQKVEFGKIVSIEDENTGVNYAKFNPDFTLHAKINQRTLYQTYQAEQSGLLDTRTVVIRHNPKVNESLKCKLSSTVYDILSINSDESSSINRYDTLILRKNKKVGA